MLLKIVCLLMRWLFSLAVLMVRGDRERDAELLVLPHENAVLRRHAGRVRYEPVGAENPCHLAGCSAGRWSLGPASGTCESGLGLPGREMIFGLRA